MIPVFQNADLVIAEAYFYDKKVKYHLDYQTLMSKVSQLSDLRLVVTHMSEDMLSRLHYISCDYAEDGKEFEL